MASALPSGVDGRLTEPEPPRRPAPAPTGGAARSGSPPPAMAPIEQGSVTTYLVAMACAAWECASEIALSIARVVLWICASVIA